MQNCIILSLRRHSGWLYGPDKCLGIGNIEIRDTHGGLGIPYWIPWLLGQGEEN